MISTQVKAMVFAMAATGVAGAATAEGQSSGGAGASGLYGFVFGGTSLNSDLNFDGNIQTPAGINPQTVDNDFDNGFQLGFGIGKSIDAWSTSKIGVRGEIELSYSDTDADSIAFSGNGPAPEANVAGGIQTTAIFANVLADFKTGSAVTPFVGGGLGIGRINQDLFYGPGVRINDSDTVFAAQLIAGLSYAASDRVTLTADIRHREFFNVGSARLNPAGASTGNVSGDLSSTSLNVGVRFGF